MNNEILCNIFEPGQKSLLCRLQIDGKEVVGVEHSPASGEQAREYRFAVTPETLSFAGDEGSTIALRNEQGVVLYVDRSLAEHRLKSVASSDLLRKFEQENHRVKRSAQKASLGLAGLAASIVLACFIAVKMLNWGVDRAVDQIPVSWEGKLGELVAQNFDENKIEDPAVVKPVRAVLDRVLTSIGENPYEFKLMVVKDPQVNALAAPGGQIVVFTGLLEKAERPEELAGVLGHEIQHVLGRHGLRKMAHAVKWQLIAAVVVGDVGGVQQVLLGHAPEFLGLSYGRGLEEEADLEGCRLLMAADVDPHGLTDFFQTLSKEEATDVKIPAFLSSHPETEQRIAVITSFVQTEADKNQKFQAIDVDWAALQAAIKKLD